MVMSLYKEFTHCVNQIVRGQKVLYNDAADFGTPIKKGDLNWNALKQLTEWYGKKELRKVEKYSTGKTVSTVVSMINEHSNGREREFEVVYTTLSDKRGPMAQYDGYVLITENGNVIQSPISTSQS